MKSFQIVAIIIFILVIALFFLAGYYIGLTPVLDKEVSQQKVEKELIGRLREAGILMPVSDTLNEVDGELVEIKSNSLVIEPREDVRFNPAGAFFPDKMEFHLNEGTEFYSGFEKENFTEEYAAYEQERDRRVEAGESLEDLVKPSPIGYMVVDLDYIYVGDFVQIVVPNNLLTEEGIFTAQRVNQINDIEWLIY